MTGWLELSDEQRRVTVEQAAIRSGINAKAIEKDWWVTLTLKALFQSTYTEFLVFKGGTSLSKCWKLIERFSEDIDIALDPKAFGMSYEENPSKTFVEKLRRAGCEFTSTALKAELERQFASIGVKREIITIEAEPVPDKFPDTDPQVLHV
jgi:predicted nucleotidyltransferase component of viral defense system